MKDCKPNYNVLNKALKQSNCLLEIQKDGDNAYYCIDGGDERSVHVCTFLPKYKIFTLRGDFTDNVYDTLTMLLQTQMDGDDFDYSFVFSDKWNEGGDSVCNHCTVQGLWKQALENNFKEFKNKCSEIVIQVFRENKNKILSVRFV